MNLRAICCGFAVGIAFLRSVNALAISTTVIPVAPYAYDSAGDLNYSVHATAPIDLGDGYKRLSSTASASSPLSTSSSTDDALIRLTISTDANSAAAGSYFVASVFFEGGSNYFVVPLAYAWGSPCIADNTCQRYGTQAPITSLLTQVVLGTPASGTNTSAEVGIYLLDICKAAQAAGDTISGCSGGAVSAPAVGSGVTLNFKVIVGAVTNNTTDLSASATDGASVVHEVKIWNTQPATFSCPDLSNVYYPGDGEILVDSNLFHDAGSTPAVDRILVVAKSGGTPSTGTSFYTQSPIGRINLTSDDWQAVTGFTNSSQSQAVSYTLAFGLRDSSGAVQFSGPCTLAGVKTAAIFGLLKSSRCFIATGTFRDANHPAVKILREFRDRTLLSTQAGRSLVSFYYRHSPRAAAWILENESFRYPVMAVLFPIVGLVWIWLHLGTALGLAVVGLLLGVLVMRMRKKSLAAKTIVLVLVAGFSGVFSAPSVQAQESESYTEVIKQDLEQVPTAANYTETERKKIGLSDPGSSSEGYSELLKEANPGDESLATSNADYAAREKAKLPAMTDRDRRSPIQSVKDGRGELQERKEGTPHHQWGFFLGASVNRNITATDDTGTNDFSSVYTDKWSPEVHVFYEYQFLKGESAGSLGLFSSVGASYSQGYGKYQIPLVNPTTGQIFDDSLVKFKFLSFPLSLGLKYTLGLFDSVQPYVVAGGAMVLYAETRSDRADVLKGYTPGMRGSAGVNILIDRAMANNGWDIYMDSGIHHTYLSLDFTYWVAHGDVSFDNKAINVGLSYDF